MDTRYSLSATIPPGDDQTPHTVRNQTEFNHQNNTNPSTPITTRYFHRAPLIFPQHHQQRLRTPSPRFSSSYLGPLNQHRSRFLSAWDLTPRSNPQSSTRNHIASTPTPIPVSEQYDQAAHSPRSPMHHAGAAPSDFYDENAHFPQPTVPNSSRHPPATVPTPGQLPKSTEMDSRTPKVSHSSRYPSGTASTPRSAPKHHDEHSRSSRPSSHKATRNTFASLQTPPSVPKQHDESSRSSRPTIHNSLRNSLTNAPTVTAAPQSRAEGSCIFNSCVFYSN
jgi:hypothetical protein